MSTANYDSGDDVGGDDEYKRHTIIDGHIVNGHSLVNADELIANSLRDPTYPKPVQMEQLAHNELPHPYVYYYDGEHKMVFWVSLFIQRRLAAINLAQARGTPVMYFDNTPAGLRTLLGEPWMLVEYTNITAKSDGNSSNRPGGVVYSARRPELRAYEELARQYGQQSFEAAIKPHRWWDTAWTALTWSGQFERDAALAVVLQHSLAVGITQDDQVRLPPVLCFRGDSLADIESDCVYTSAYRSADIVYPLWWRSRDMPASLLAAMDCNGELFWFEATQHGLNTLQSRPWVFHLNHVIMDGTNDRAFRELIFYYGDLEHRRYEIEPAFQRFVCLRHCLPPGTPPHTTEKSVRTIAKPTLAEALRIFADITMQTKRSGIIHEDNSSDDDDDDDEPLRPPQLRPPPPLPLPLQKRQCQPHHHQEQDQDPETQQDSDKEQQKPQQKQTQTQKGRPWKRPFVRPPHGDREMYITPYSYRGLTRYRVSLPGLSSNRMTNKTRAEAITTRNLLIARHYPQ
jgi:hypothetical protein